MNCRKWSLILTLIGAALLGCAGCGFTPWARWKNQERLRLEQESEVVQTALGPIECALVGDGPTVLMLHGSTGGYDQGLLLGSVLSGIGIRTLSVSRPGYLRTPLEVGKTPELQADACAALLDVMGIERVAVAGGSGGGPIALQFALRHADRCWGLLLFSAVIHRQDFGRFPLMQRISFNLSFGDFVNWRMLRSLEKNPVKALTKVFPATASMVSGDPDKLGLAVVFLKANFPMSLRKAGTFNDLDQGRSQPDYPLESISVPSLILHGTADAWVALEHAELAARRIPHARLIRFEGADHLFFIPYKEEVLALLSRFVEDNAP